MVRREGREGRKGRKGKKGRKGREERKGRKGRKGNELDASPGASGPSLRPVLVPVMGTQSWCPRTVRVPVLRNPVLVPQDWVP